MDTGIQSNHTTFTGRVSHGFDCISSSPLNSDPHGHGTQVAGIIAGVSHGVCQSANIIDVRVANSSGKSSSVQILAGLDYIVGLSLSLSLHPLRSPLVQEDISRVGRIHSELSSRLVSLVRSNPESCDTFSTSSLKVLHNSSPSFTES
jgi:subtilisin family serine protease